MIRRAYYSNPVEVFLQDDPEKILGSLAAHHDFALEELQRNAWQKQVGILKESLAGIGKGLLALEYAIPRMGKRVDAVLLVNGLVFVIEFKVGETNYRRAALDQVMDYALDLKNFHAASHTLQIIPMLVATHADGIQNSHKAYEDLVYEPLKANASNLRGVLDAALKEIPGDAFDPQQWIEAAYKPTPTIIQAAQALYQGHTVADISRSEAGATNLTKTSDAILKIIHHSKTSKQKAICFVTGVPGAGKTLAGLNIANARLQTGDDEHAVFLSGNGPLVTVLREALARDAVQAAKEGTVLKPTENFENDSESEANTKTRTKKQELRKTSRFIQNIHHFRDEALVPPRAAPHEKVVIFDEAQRAWTLKQTADFMRRKRGQLEWDRSEPAFLISVMDRHPEWAVLICLIGGGQEINTGEAGLGEWFAALGKSFGKWKVYVSNQLTDSEYTRGTNFVSLLAPEQIEYVPELHLGVSIRSFRSEKVSELVKAVLDLQSGHAQELYRELRGKYPIVLTRDLAKARAWVKEKERGTERTGLLASSGGIRLRPVGIDVKSEIEVANWFLNDKDDVRSSFALEQAATEFDIQGLELDWTIVAWDADLRFKDGEWDYKNFSGSSWQTVKDEQRRIYLKNAYRVLLTRARQGIVIFVPEGDNEDATRRQEFYDGTFEYLKGIGIEAI